MVERKTPDPTPSAAHDALDDGAAAFAGHRRRLFGIAYRMLGSAAEAEDVVQDVWLRWQATDRSAVVDPAAFLITTTTRLAINVAASARARRETYIGPWLPEPVDTRDDPELGAERREALALAILFLLEKLSPRERAAYVLREAFDYSYDHIGNILHLTEPNVRQLVTRARKHIADERRVPVSDAEQRRLLEAFIAAAQRGDRSTLEGLFAADIVSYTDGGGVARMAARRPVAGRDRVAQLVAGFASHFWRETTLTWLETNGQASVIVARGDAVIALATLEASASGIERIFWVMNPAKLASVAGAAAREHA